ncbi:MAG TPA: extracellular solute-binding protein [Gemmatimonadales bacterium]|nr:extracellular solute-binding protein [Gemmatimonadales bacterium]
MPGGKERGEWRVVRLGANRTQVLHRLVPLATPHASFWSILFVLALTACTRDHRTPLVIYSPHGRDLLTLLSRRFEEQHAGVVVHWLDMGSQEVYDRLRSERANPQADVWFGGPSTIFARGVPDSLLAPFRPAWADAIASHGRGPGDFYFAAYLTPAVIVYATEALTPEQAPRDWDDLLDPRWRGKILIRDPLASGTMRAVWGMIVERALAATGDTTAGFRWLRRLDAQTKEYVLNGTLLTQKLVRGEGQVTIWDLPDILLNIRDSVPLGYVFPTSGAPVIEDAIGVVRGAPHAALAREFVDWVGSVGAEALAAGAAYRLPARTDLPDDSLPEWVRAVRRKMTVASVNWDLLAARGDEWMRRWDETVRGKGNAAAP